MRQRFPLHRAAWIAIAWAILPRTSAFAEAGPEASPARVALEASWAERSAPGDSLEIVYVPELPGDGTGVVHVIWPDPPIPPGPRALTVERVVDGRVVARALANVVVRRDIPVWVLQRSIARGDTARAADLRMETRTWDREPVRALTGDLPARGLLVLRDLTAGSWVRSSDVRARPDVDAGDDILLITRTDGVVVSIPTAVRRSGSVGDVILVLNPLTGSVVRARLVDTSRAELLTARARAERKQT